MSLSDDSSSLSSLSPAPSSSGEDDDVAAAEVRRVFGIERYFKPAGAGASTASTSTSTSASVSASAAGAGDGAATHKAGVQARLSNKRPLSPPSPARSPSPPHEYVLADKPDIAFIVMFRARFGDAFPRSLPHFGPQDIEREITPAVPGEQVERLLCALIGLCLNRKKEVERGHYARALEEVIATHASQWPRAWGGVSPVAGGRTFAALAAEEKLTLLRALILWSLSSSDAIQTTIKRSYRRARHENDITQPLSVQPWGADSQGRRYWLIEGRDDTHFRLYREGAVEYPSPPRSRANALNNTGAADPQPTWWSVAGSIAELRGVADALGA
ncbi:hypothetical protein KEM52_001695, partial [Ascosphaera acerosa]